MRSSSILRQKLKTLTRSLLNSILKSPQLDFAGIIKNKELLKDSILRRKLPPSSLQDLDFIVASRDEQLSLQRKVDSLRHRRTTLGAQMKKNVDEAIKLELKEIKSELSSLESSLSSLQSELLNRAESLPNYIHSSVPHSDEVVKFINCDSEADAELRFLNKLSHREIGESLGILDFQTASRVSGNSSYYLLGDGALLEQALVQYGLAKARKRGYKMVIPPTMVRPEVINACGFKPKDQNGEKQIYELANETKSLIGTAEIPLGALHSSTTFPPGTKFPIKYVGVSRSYRAEAGARGKDTKGLYRVHEFTKVELFHFTTAKLEDQELEDLKDFQIEIITELGLCAKVLNMQGSDLGAPAMKKYDCEAWMPGRGNWGELTSSSNCGTYQARRLGIKYDDQSASTTHVSTLNGTCMAVPRVIVAIIELNYDPETNSIKIPDVLVPYMDGKDRIYKN